MSVGNGGWTGVGLDRQIQASSSNPVILHGQALAVWRGQEGPVRIWEDRCPHRGMRLSFGFVRGNTLRCIYHGWAYDTDGQCVEIPAHPALTPPKTICAQAFPATTRYGIVWTNLSGADEARLPDLGDDEGWEPVRTIFIDKPVAEVTEAVQRFDFGPDGRTRMADGNVAAIDLGALRMLIAIQPVDEARTALHAVVRGATESGGRASWARKLERLRAVAERS